MFGSIGLTISGIVFISLIAIFYFSKKRRKSLENTIFKELLIFTICLLLLEIVCVLFMANASSYPITTEVVCRLYILGVIFWCITLFVYLLSLNIDYKNNYNLFNEKYLKIITVIGSVAFFVSCFFPIKYTSNSGRFYVINGSAVSILYICFFFLSCYICYFMIKNKTTINTFKRIPLILFLVILLIVSVCQFFYDDFNELTFLFAFCVIGIYFTIENSDITLIEELEIANEKAIQADKEKTEFLSRISHEIRTPINSIMGFSEAIMNEKKLSTKILREDSKNINIAANNLLEIIENILDISNIESGHELVNNENYSIKDIVYELNSYVQSKINKDVEFVFNIDKEIPLMLNGDKVKIHKILYSILANSIKFTKSGQIKLNIYSQIDKNDVELKFVVADTGIGIKEENIDKIFDKFSRLNTQEVIENYNSTGLGLTIVKDLVDLLGGSIQVESTYGVGTTFIVKLMNKVVDKNNIGTVSLIKYDTENYIDCSKYSILLVDDNALTLKATKDMLKNFKLNISTCNNGNECINKIKSKEKYDILMINTNLKDLSGIETINTLKNLNDCLLPNIIIAVSEESSNNEKAMCIDIGFTDYLTRPLEYKKLKKLILKYFNDKKEGK